MGLLPVPVGVYLYMRSGDTPAATSAPPMPFERFLAHTALRATIERRGKPETKPKEKPSRRRGWLDGAIS